MDLPHLGVPRGLLLCVLALIAPLSAEAQQAGSSNGASPGAPAPKVAPLPVFDIPPSGVQLQTGDTWTQGGQTFRLYAVQSCIRRTTFTNAAGMKRDCGEASIAYFAALIKDAKPRCTAVAQSGSVTFAVCAAHIGAADARPRHDSHHAGLRFRRHRSQWKARELPIRRRRGRRAEKQAGPLGFAGSPSPIGHSQKRLSECPLTRRRDEA